MTFPAEVVTVFAGLLFGAWLAAEVAERRRRKRQDAEDLAVVDRITASWAPKPRHAHRNPRTGRFRKCYGTFIPPSI